jgi:chaperonin cofactor prefoldin
MDRYQESRKRGVESRNKTAMRYKIRGIVSELNTLLLKPTAKKHIKEELRKEVADALSAINMDTVDADARVAMYNDLIAKEKNPDVIAELTKTRDRIQLQGDNLKEKLNNLQSAYEKIKNTDDIELNLAYQEVIQNSIKAVSEKVGKTSIRNMTLEQLEMVYDLFSMIRKTIRDANKSFKEQKGLTITQMAEAVNDPESWLRDNKEIIEQYRELRKTSEFQNSPGFKLMELLRKFNEEQGYNTIFIPAMRRLSPAYDEYMIRLQKANQVFLNQYQQ